MKAIVACMALLALAACTAPMPPEVRSAGETEAHAAGHGPCAAGFVAVTPGKPACGFALQPDGSLMAGERHYPPIIATYLQDQSGTMPIAAKKLILFPPSPHGLRIIQACDGEDTTAECWSVRLVDRSRNNLLAVNGGKYGPRQWISWSPQGDHVALISQNEGARWLHVLDTQTGATTDYPSATANENWQIDEDSLVWNDESSFTVSIRRCETCDVERRSFGLRPQ
jgi:hypothetical protein